MASGSFTGTTGNKYIKARIVWSSTPNTLNNRSSVTATLYYGKSSSSSSATYGTIECALTINGSTKSFSQRVTLNPNDTWVAVGSHTVTVNHSTDGAKSIVISASGGIPGLTFSSTNCSATVILDKIPRATTPTFGASTQTIGSNVVINLPAADSSFYHTLTYSWGNLSGTIGTNLKTSKTWGIPITFCEGVPNGTQGTLFVTAETFMSNGTSLGKVTKSTPCNVPASVVPSISEIALSDSGGQVPSSWGVYVRGKSQLHVNVTAAGRYYSRIVGYSIKALGVTVTSNDSDVGIIPTAGTMNVEVTVTDSRGRTATSTKSITVEDYTEPTVESFSVERANSSGTATDNGTYAKIPLKVSASPISNKNTVEAKIYHMRSDATTWTLARTIPVAYSIDQTVMVANMIASRSYAIKVEVVDVFGTTVAESTLNAEGAVMGWMPGGIGISFGKAAEEDYTADFDWVIHGRKGAQFDDDVTVDGKITGDSSGLTRNGLPTLQCVDIATLTLGGTNFQLGTANTYMKIPFSKYAYNLTNVLTISENGILIPAGVRAVKVSAQICLGAATAGVRYAQIAKNGWVDAVARSQRHHASTATPETHSIPSALLTVSEGDIIVLGVYGNASDWVYGNHNQTYLMVEAYA
ncbi:MAG: hypothetical protein J6V38_07705 [Kiritimatiellae bacterium]|nr:hypothetical protein [Kiritimatiellia bacterium]